MNRGKRGGVPAEVADRLNALARESNALQQPNEILRKASTYLAQAVLGSVLAHPPDGLCACAPFKR